MLLRLKLIQWTIWMHHARIAGQDVGSLEVLYEWQHDWEGETVAFVEAWPIQRLPPAEFVVQIDASDTLPGAVRDALLAYLHDLKRNHTPN